MKANMPKQIANKDYVSVVEELEDNRRMQGNITIISHHEKEFCHKCESCLR